MKHGSLKHPTKTGKTKRQECPSTSKWIAENNVHPTPFHGKKRKPNAIKTAERTQPTAENPLVKRCVGEEKQNEGTSAVETPSVEEFEKEEEEGEGKSAMETCCVEHCCNEEQQKEETSAVDTPSVDEFVRAVSAEGSTAMETPSVEEFVNEKVKEEESTAVKTSSMEECVVKVKQVEVTSSVETPLRRNENNLDENNLVQEKRLENTAF